MRDLLILELGPESLDWLRQIFAGGTHARPTCIQLQPWTLKKVRDDLVQFLTLNSVIYAASLSTKV
jgi:hypothetical protein